MGVLDNRIVGARIREAEIWSESGMILPGKLESDKHQAGLWISGQRAKIRQTLVRELESGNPS